MKKFATIIGTILLAAIASTALGEVVIREEPLRWDQVAQLDGHEMYGNLCAACHGMGGKGDGPASTALDKPVPDLTVLAANNDGVFSHRRVTDAIYGNSRVIAHNTIDMPSWGQQFMYFRTGWSSFQREAYTRNRIHALTGYIEDLQVE